DDRLASLRAKLAARQDDERRRIVTGAERFAASLREALAAGEAGEGTPFSAAEARGDERGDAPRRRDPQARRGRPDPGADRRGRAAARARPPPPAPGGGASRGPGGGGAGAPPPHRGPRRTTHYPHRGVTASQRRQAHIDWLKLIEVSGPFLSVPVLTAEWPDLEALDARDLERLRQEHRQWQEDPARSRADWTGYVLGELLGWGEAIQWAGLDRLALEVPEHEATLIPSFTLADPGTGQPVLLGLVSDGSPVARIAGSDWPATPADRLAMLCRHHGIE